MVNIICDETTATSLCRACGAMTPGRKSCAVCSTTLACVDNVDPLVGCAVTVPGRLRSRQGTVLGSAEDGLKVVVGSRVATIKPPDIAIDSPIHSAGYRLLLVTRSTSDRASLKILAAATEAVLTELPSGRAFASEALHNSDWDAVRMVLPKLSPTEANWLEMWWHHMKGDGSKALDRLRQLPNDGYPDKVAIIAAWIQPSSPEELLKLTAQHLDPIAHQSNEAAFLLWALGLLQIPPSNSSHSQVTAAPWSGPTAIPGVRPTGTEARLHEVGAILSDPLGSLAPYPGTYAAVWRAISHERSNPSRPNEAWSIEATCPEIPVLPRSIVDEMIDCGVLAMGDGDLGMVNPHIRARLDPDSMSDSELTSVEAEDELTRRRFVRGETVEAAHDATDERRVLAALSSLRSGNILPLKEILDLLPDEHAITAQAVITSVESGAVLTTALADPSVWTVLGPILPSGKDLSEAPPTVRRVSEHRYLAEARHHLYQWDWTAAAVSARECLRTAEDEGLRDEALNYLACAHLHQGNNDAALGALAEAIAGADSPELIVNYGVVASDTDPVAAAGELGRLALEAPSLVLRLTAARRALMLWGSHVPGEDSDEASDPPIELISAMRLLSVENTSIDEHRTILKFLSWADSEWLAEAHHTAASPYRDTPAHQYLVARATGAEDGVNALADMLRQSPEDHWLIAERNNLIEGVIDALLEDGVNLGVGLWALSIADSTLDRDERQGFLLRVFGTRALARYFLTNETDGSRGPLKQEFFTRLSDYSGKPLSIGDIDPEAAAELVQETIDLVAIACIGGWHEVLDRITGAVDTINDQLRGMARYRINWSVVQRAAMPLRSSLTETNRDVMAVLRAVEDEDADEALKEIVDYAARISVLLGQLKV